MESDKTRNRCQIISDLHSPKFVALLFYYRLMDEEDKMSVTLKDRQRQAVIPNNTETPMIVKDRQQHSSTSYD